MAKKRSGYSICRRRVCGGRVRYYVICTDPKGGEWIVSKFTRKHSEAREWRDQLNRLDKHSECAGRLTAWTPAEELAQLIADEIATQGNETDNLGDNESIVLVGDTPTINLAQLAERIIAYPRKFQ